MPIDAAREGRIRRHFDGARQLHAAGLRILPRRQHAGLREHLARRRGGGGHVHARAVEMRLLDIDQAIERFEFLGRHALAQVEHAGEGFGECSA